MNIRKEIANRLSQSIGAAYPDGPDMDPMVMPSGNPQFGDYQANCAMSLSKRLKGEKKKPREVAQAIVSGLEAGDMLETCEIAGPGFINMRLRRDFLEQTLARVAGDERLGIAPTRDPRTVVVDFGSPNTCKPMHVGHIRSLVIGDAICRLLHLLGRHVIADNHLGDWGTQFGLLIAGYKRWPDEPLESDHPLEILVSMYKKANALAEQDATFQEQARQELAKLQAGDPENLKLWHLYRELSERHFESTYERLDIHFDKTLGESFYNDMLPGVVEELTAAGLARKSEGAMCIFWDDDSLPPLLVQKKDGAYLYATTDLATLKYRRETWNPDEIVYVTDARQRLHFKQLFSAGQRWGVAEGIRLRHIWFGTILGPNGRPLKTRSGDLVPLKDVLDEAERRALEIVRQKNPDLDDKETTEISRVVGLGAIKYADLSQNRQSDFIFDWDKMLAMQGNTAPYLQYSYARIRSIFRKATQAT
ncbi:MAG: arginine--tRNA ligase, partial [Anaerolineaceae bacterium]|nr:arginine--tRNA ligase [Anaerolineaceae bacterium]